MLGIVSSLSTQKILEEPDTSCKSAPSDCVELAALPGSRIDQVFHPRRLFLRIAKFPSSTIPISRVAYSKFERTCLPVWMPSIPARIHPRAVYARVAHKTRRRRRVPGTPIS